MNKETLYQTFKKYKVVPVIAIEEESKALALADALIEGGLPVAEITFRTAAAAKVIDTLSKQRPELLVGAGTILTIDNLKRAIDCGATFGLAPGLNPAVVEEALKLNFPFSPGVMTPSDIEKALSLGVTKLKFFPAEAAGGTGMLKSLIGPYAHTGVEFIPTGGISMKNIKEYLSIQQVLAVGGTWVATKENIKNDDWETIIRNCQEILRE
ncbi:MAG: bifunctional 4-hydroxy-2-oxoglutarate aldolase/2-dehydro-3-deoxy-phosphogluconate aldolase [Bacteroidia bacterium]|jgi:2-dehydro-3-deoxyphosphogluconate aldolase / (4S)-4-hydroxy-2-oxoglutarate aldolase